MFLTCFNESFTVIAVAVNIQRNKRRLAYFLELYPKEVKEPYEICSISLALSDDRTSE